MRPSWGTAWLCLLSRVALLWVLLCCNLVYTLWRWLVVNRYTLFPKQEKRPFQAKPGQHFRLGEPCRPGSFNFPGKAKQKEGSPAPGQSQRWLLAKGYGFTPASEPAGQSSRRHKHPQKGRLAGAFMPSRHQGLAPGLSKTPKHPQAARALAQEPSPTSFRQLVTGVL